MLRPAYAITFALATVLVLAVIYFSDLGPRGRAAYEGKKLDARLKFAMRGTDDEQLATLVDFLEAAAGPEQEIPDGSPLSMDDRMAGGTDAGFEAWLGREEDMPLTGADRSLPQLIGELTAEEMSLLRDQLAGEMAAG